MTLLLMLAGYGVSVVVATVRGSISISESQVNTVGMAETLVSDINNSESLVATAEVSDG